MRKAFNFYRSYYDMALELPESERLTYLMAIIQMQFTGEEPSNLCGMAKFAFISQKHSIIKQLEGYKFGLQTPPQKGPSKGASKVPSKEPLPQVQVQEKVKDKVLIPTFNEFLDYAKTQKSYNSNLEHAIQIKYESWVANGWVDGYGNKIERWKGKLISTLPHLKPIEKQVKLNWKGESCE